MKTPGLPLTLLAIAGFAGRGLAQVAEPAPVASTAVSEIYSEVSCTSTDAGLNADVLQLAEDAREQLSPILNLGRDWRFPVHIIIALPDDPKAGKITREGVAVFTGDKTMTLEAALPGADPDAHAFIQRQFVTALLWEKFFAGTKKFTTATRLDVVPTWLIEGLTEWLRQDAGRDREAIVKRAAEAERAPTLAEVTGWQEISTDRLPGIYQRAFCYYLVNSLLAGNEKRAEFQQWLATYAGPNPSSAKFLFPTETDWRRQLLEAPARSHDIIYTWDDTASALTTLDPVVIGGKDAKNTRVFTLDNVVSQVPDPALLAAVQKKVFALTELELRAHPDWRVIVGDYRLGLTAYANAHYVEAANFIGHAKVRRATEEKLHQKLVDYVNWFEVTKDVGVDTSPFQSYFFTAKEMEKAQGDLDQPNPVRAGLIHVESQL